jgi:formate dehydrogenase subunit gamma
MSTSLLRAWLTSILLGLAVLLVAAPAGAQLTQSPGADSPASKADVPVYRAEEGKLLGRVSIPDGKLAVLVQPEGREWREFRRYWLPRVAGLVILGAAAALLAFYLLKGTIRLESGRAGTTVPRFNGLERAGHWLTSVSFILLALTGLVVTFGRTLLIPVIGHEAFTALSQASVQAHNYLGLPFFLGVLLIGALWLRDNLPEKADLEWLRQGGGILSGGKVHPEAGRFNAGQKGIYWVVVLGGLAMAASGLVLLLPFSFTGIGGMQVAHVVHALVAALMIAVILAHIYIGTVGMEGAFDAMGSGRVDENWAREHHSRWYNRLKGREGPAGTPAE